MQNDWRLTYGNTDFAFGTVESQFVFPQSGPPEISNLTIRDEDADRPRGDGVIFGQDYRSGTTVTFDVEVNGADEDEVRLNLQSMSKAWRADEIRTDPGAVAMLTAHTGRVTFGRPRRFQPKFDLLPFGVTALSCDFATADDLWYGPEQATSVALVADVGGGLVAPLAAPLSTTASSDRSQTFTVDGTMPVWPVISISGPITNPVIEVPGEFRMAFRLTLAYDQTLVIDTRPWARSITRNGASVAGSRDPRTSRLSDSFLPPGTYDFAFSGTSATGTPRALIQWRDAYPTF